MSSRVFIVYFTTCWVWLIPGGSVHSEQAEGIEHQAYGIYDAFRHTNLYQGNYNAPAGWVESRWILGDRYRADRSLRPYLKTTLALSGHPHPWENTFVYGVGVEIRPFMYNRSLETPSLQWLQSTRVYAEALQLEYCRDDWWQADHDWRVGLEVYREWNVDPLGRPEHQPYPFKRRWAELWTDLSYRDTNFYTRDYESLTFGAVARVGIRASHLGQDTYLMPYALTDISYVPDHGDFFWQNRVLLGVGLRVMPFQRSRSEYLNKLRLYVEYMRRMAYLQEEPLPGTPNVEDDDLRVGFIFTRNRW